MTRATVEESMAGLGQTLSTGRPLVGGLRFHGRLWDVHEFTWHTGCQEAFKPRVYETPRPMHAWSLALDFQLVSVREAAKTDEKHINTLSLRN